MVKTRAYGSANNEKFWFFSILFRRGGFYSVLFLVFRVSWVRFLGELFCDGGL